MLNCSTAKFSFIILFLFNSLFITLAQNNPINQSLHKLNTEITILKKSPALKHATWSVYVMNCTNSKILTEYNSELSLIPASTLKIVTGTTALSLLGKDFQFKTLLETDGSIDSSGTLHGDLNIRGGGDPTFGSNRFDTLTFYKNIFTHWLNAVKQKGIKKIDGAVICDASIFDDESIAESWMWCDIGNYYGAGSSGLSFYENSYDIVFKPAAIIGETADILLTEPEIPGIKFTNLVTTAKAETYDNVNVYGTPYTYDRTLTGTVPYRKDVFIVKGAIPDSPYLCAFLFEKFLKENHIEILKPVATNRMLDTSQLSKSKSRTLIATHLSPTLEKIIYETNEFSINTYAENLLKYIGYFKNHEGTRSSGIHAVKEFWKSKGINLEGFSMNDGCGLSRTNNITAHQLAGMLYEISKDSIFQTYFKTLPIGGGYESLKKYLKEHFIENNFRAKSGAMSKIRSYAGYVRTKNNQLLAFAIILNNYDSDKFTIREEMIKLMELIAELD